MINLKDTTEIKKFVQEQALLGKTDSDLAERLGMPKGTFRYLLRSKGVSTPKQYFIQHRIKSIMAIPEKERTTLKVQEVCGFPSTHTTAAFMNRYSIPFIRRLSGRAANGTTDIKIIEKLLNQGYTGTEIAETLDVCPSRIYSLMSIHKIKSPRGPGSIKGKAAPRIKPKDLVHRWKRGSTVSDLVKYYNSTHATIYRILKKEGLR